jgi:hypothetical protein
MATRRFRIADLYPYEPGAVRSSYDYHLPMYENGVAVPTPVVLDLGDGDWMVIQGNNRTKAAKDAGVEEMDFEIGFRQKQEMRPFRDTKDIRGAQGQKGFENYPVFASETDRSAATKTELKRFFGI